MAKVKQCPSCEEVLPGRARFCSACGLELEDAPAAPEPEKGEEKYLTVEAFEAWQKKQRESGGI